MPPPFFFFLPSSFGELVGCNKFKVRRIKLSESSYQLDFKKMK